MIYAPPAVYDNDPSESQKISLKKLFHFIKAPFELWIVIFEKFVFLPPIIATPLFSHYEQDCIRADSAGKLYTAIF